MKKIIVVAVIVASILGVLAPPAEANVVSDAASTVGRKAVDVTVGAAHVLGSVIEPVVEFIKKTTTKAVMVAKEHPVMVGVGLGLLVATIIVPPLMSVDGEILATVETVEVETVVAEETAVVGAVTGVETVGAETITVIESATESESSVVTGERCYVALDICGTDTPSVERDAKRTLTTAQKEALKDRACGPMWCVSELTGEQFPRSEAQIDHIIPHALGGNTSIPNSQVISQAENWAKGATLPK